MSKIKSAHEVYFLVRVGQMSEEDLNQWLQDSINATINDEDQYEDFEKDWDTVDDWDC